MAGKGEGEGEGNLAKLENQISVLKYVMLFTNVIIWVSVGIMIFLYTLNNFNLATILTQVVCVI